MPFTPLHMGAGAVLKAALGRRFSLVVFGGSQVVMDLQPLLVMLSGKGALHGITHTLAGATVLGLFCAVTGKPLGEWFLRGIGQGAALPLRWSVVFSSALLGVYSHLLLDSLMHADMQPLAPLSAASPLYGWIAMQTLELGCLAAAVAGALVWALRRRRRRRA